jgi:predicted  nucleic acid-binding Zn-ribbon protein
MTAPGAILREIHRLRKNAKDLQAKIELGPRQLKAQQDKVTRHEQLLKEAQDRLKHLKVHTHEKEVSLKSTDQTVKKYEGQLSGIMSKKEYDALRTEIQHARDQAGKLEDEILEVLTQTEEQAAKIPELEKALKEAKAQADTFTQEYEARMADYTRQRAAALQELAQIEASLPEDIRPLYERLIKLKGEDAISAVESRICVACYTEITAQQQQDLLRGMWVLCKNCGRIVYLAE